jgi:type I thyroxine 5'-deiodinase
MPDNEREDVCYTQPRSTPQRLAIARDFVKRFDYPLPMLVDPIENRANEIYAGWPERLVIIDEHGRVAYKGKPGPFGYHPEELADWLSHRFQRS